MTEPRDPQLLRVISNNLWPHLKRGRWSKATTKRDTTHNPITGRDYAPTPAFRNAAPTTETIDIDQYLYILVYPEENHLNTGLAIHLERNAYNTTIEALPEVERFDLLAAYTLSSCRYPFVLQPNRHGHHSLRRNPHDGTITQSAANALQAIAAAARVTVVTEERLEAMITDDDVSLPVIEAAVMRGES